MKLLKWIPFLYSFLLFGQSSDTIIDINTTKDSLQYQLHQNSFSDTDEATILGYNILEQSHQSNFGPPIIRWDWQTIRSFDLGIGDKILDFGTPNGYKEIVYSQKYPHTKIIYSQGYTEGQRLNFIHKRRYKYGSWVLDYDRLVSEGFLWHDKNKFTKFSFRSNFKHPVIPYESKLIIHTFKNQSEWNGGISNNSLFLSGSQTNWELLPVNWSNLESSIKHFGLDWRQTYSHSDEAQFAYEIGLSQDSLFYTGLNDDSLFYPNQLDSATTYQRAFSNMIHQLGWEQKIKDDKIFNLGLKHQTFKDQSSVLYKWTAYTSLQSDYFKNKIFFELGKERWNTHTLQAIYTQNINFLSIQNELRIAYQRALPTWLQRTGTNLNQSPYFSCIVPHNTPIIDQFVEWNSLINKNFKWSSSYHNIDGFTYFNASAAPISLDEPIQVFKSSLTHHLNWRKLHWVGNAIYQNSSSDQLPIAKVLLNQKTYWQGKLFKEATETQFGVRGLYRSSHPGMNFSPILGDFLVNPLFQTPSSIRLDLFANFQIQSLKVYAAFENFNGLWQEPQYVLGPYPMAQPTFRLSLIWNFYD